MIESKDNSKFFHLSHGSMVIGSLLKELDYSTNNIIVVNGYNAFDNTNPFVVGDRYFLRRKLDMPFNGVIQGTCSLGKSLESFFYNNNDEPLYGDIIVKYEKISGSSRIYHLIPSLVIDNYEIEGLPIDSDFNFRFDRDYMDYSKTMNYRISELALSFFNFHINKLYFILTSSFKLKDFKYVNDSSSMVIVSNRDEIDYKLSLTAETFNSFI